MASTSAFIRTPSLPLLSTPSGQTDFTIVCPANQLAAAHSSLHGRTAGTLFFHGTNMLPHWSEHRRRWPRQLPTTSPNVSDDHVDYSSSQFDVPPPHYPFPPIPVTLMTSETGGDKQVGAGTGTDAFELSEESMRLLREQVAHPLFVPGDVHDPLLRRALEAAQPSQPPYHFLSAIPSNGDTTDIDDNAMNSSIPAASTLVAQHSNAAVQAARAAVLAMFPGITEPGGELYPQYRSDACWRDLNAFARVAGYACAVAATSTTTTKDKIEQGEDDDSIYSDKGFDVLAKVYAKLDVPLQAVVAGVHGLWAYYLSVALSDVDGVAVVTETKRDTCQHLDVAFSALIKRLRQLKS